VPKVRVEKEITVEVPVEDLVEGFVEGLVGNRRPADINQYDEV